MGKKNRARIKYTTILRDGKNKNEICRGIKVSITTNMIFTKSRLAAYNLANHVYTVNTFLYARKVRSFVGFFLLLFRWILHSFLYFVCEADGRFIFLIKCTAAGERKKKKRWRNESSLGIVPHFIQRKRIIVEIDNFLSSVWNFHLPRILIRRFSRLGRTHREITSQGRN